MGYRPPTIAGMLMAFEVSPSKPPPVVEEGVGEPEERTTDGRPAVDDVGSPPDEEVGGTLKVIGTFP